MKILRKNINDKNILLNSELNFKTDLGWEECFQEFEQDTLGSIINPIENFETTRYIHKSYTGINDITQSDIWYYFYFYNSYGTHNGGLDYQGVGLTPDENSRILRGDNVGFFRLEFYKAPEGELPNASNRKLVFTKHLLIPLSEKVYYTPISDYIYVPIFTGSNYRNKENMYLFWFQDDSAFAGTTLSGNTFWMTVKYYNTIDGTIMSFSNNGIQYGGTINEEIDMYNKVVIDKSDYTFIVYSGNTSHRIGTSNAETPIMFYATSLSSSSIILPPSPSVSLIPSRTPSVTPSVTPSISISVTPSVSLTLTPTVTPSISVTPSVSITPSITGTPGASPTSSPSVTPSISITPTVTPTVTTSITPTVTPSTTSTPTRTPSITPTISATPSITPTPNTNYLIDVYNCSGSSCGSKQTTIGAHFTSTPYPSIGYYYRVGSTVIYATGTTGTTSTNMSITAGPFNNCDDACAYVPSPTPTPSMSVTPSTTPSISITPTRTPSVTPSISVSTSTTPSMTPTRTPSVSITPSITPTPSVASYKYYVDVYSCVFPLCEGGLGSAYISNDMPLTTGDYYCYDANTVFLILGTTSSEPDYYTSLTIGFSSCDQACANGS